jgi:5'-methylthioadenosine phosphorylase
MLGVIGGSGLYDLPGVRDARHIEVDTPYGAPSGAILRGRLGGLEMCFLPRHGAGHRLNPSEVPYRANIHALKQLGVTHLISVSAVGSLRDHLEPGSMVLPDQVIDRTIGRDRTFFDGGVVGHVGLADPFCPTLHRHILGVAGAAGIRLERGGTYVCIEGPQFSTRAESQLYRSWNADIIGMTAMPEARLVREAGICYAIVATVSDYDVWHETEEDVSVEAVMKVLAANVERGKQLVTALVSTDLPECEHGCAAAPAGAIATHADAILEARRALVDLLTSGPTRRG